MNDWIHWHIFCAVILSWTILRLKELQKLISSVVNVLMNAWGSYFNRWSIHTLWYHSNCSYCSVNTIAFKLESTCMLLFQDWYCWNYAEFVVWLLAYLERNKLLCPQTVKLCFLYDYALNFALSGELANKLNCIAFVF